jgi:hypothetical protein
VSPKKQKEYRYRPHRAGIPWKLEGRMMFETKEHAPMVVGIQEEIQVASTIAEDIQPSPQTIE